MKILSFIPRRPTPERVRAAVEESRRKAAHRQYLKSAKYCQRCGKEVYPDKEGRYPFFEITDKKWEITLLVCEECYKKEK
jgi:hypothetical protein